MLQRLCADLRVGCSDMAGMLGEQTKATRQARRVPQGSPEVRVAHLGGL